MEIQIAFRRQYHEDGFEIAFNPSGDWSCFYRTAIFQLGFKSEILHNLISDYLGGRQYDRNSLAQNSTFGVFF